MPFLCFASRCLLGKARGQAYDIPRKHPSTMGDFTFIAISVAFFAVAIAYAYFCDRLG
jgi:hypothetical protein